MARSYWSSSSRSLAVRMCAHKTAPGNRLLPCLQHMAIADRNESFPQRVDRRAPVNRILHLLIYGEIVSLLAMTSRRQVRHRAGHAFRPRLFGQKLQTTRSNDPRDILGCEVHDRVKIVLVEQVLEWFSIADVAVHKQERFIVPQLVKIGAIACICQRIEHDDAVCRSQTAPMKGEIGADKSRTAGDQNCGHRESRQFSCAARNNEIVSPIPAAKVTRKHEIPFKEALRGYLVGQLIYDRAIHESISLARRKLTDGIDDLPDRRIEGQYVVDLPIKKVMLNNVRDSAHRVTQSKIWPLLIIGRTPDTQGLPHDRLPAEFVDGGMKTHPGRRTEDRSKAANDRL